MTSSSVNNEIYDSLGDRWYTAKDDPVALLRAEARARNPWMLERIEALIGKGSHRVLDVGCGGGFVSNALSAAGHQVTGIDLSEASLAVAARYDSTRRTRYLLGDVFRLEKLGFDRGSFDVVSAMDFLEHVENPARVILEAGQMLRPGGLFFFSTFNRNPLSALVAIRGVEWFVKNTPERLHLYRCFLKPNEVRKDCVRAGLRLEEMKGLVPRFLSRAMLGLLLTGEVSDDFRFNLTRSTAVGYVGVARKLTEAENVRS